MSDCEQVACRWLQLILHTPPHQEYLFTKLETQESGLVYRSTVFCLIFCCLVSLCTSYILVKESRSWSAAQSYCRTYHTDLTSIRSKEEKSNITLTLKGSGVQYVWIGLYRDPWAFWSDNTTSTFTNWMSGLPDNQYSTLSFCGQGGQQNIVLFMSCFYFYCLKTVTAMNSV
uniref:C-type lectin domain-containing protein n=1 Tax=Pundamilia nyererei TaxID=303518 RepID=A0A3B4F463_9CICH